MNPKQSVASSGQKRSPPRRACKKCPACLAPPCKMCSNCLNAKFKKRCKQRVCPNLGQQTPSSSSPPSSAATRQLVESCPSTSTGISSTGDTTSIFSNLLSSITSRDAVELQDSQADHRSEVAIKSPSTSSQQLESQETRGRTRQRLQEEHIRLKAVYRNFVLAKKDSSGLAGWSYQCLKCDKFFKTKIVCTRHTSTCEKSFTGKKRSKNLRQIICNKCPFKATTEADLEMHRREAHPEVKTQRVPCLTCGDTFSSAKTLKGHILKVHKKIGMFSCDICDKEFGKKFNLVRHKDSHLRDQATRESERLTLGQTMQGDRRLDVSSHTFREHEEVEVPDNVSQGEFLEDQGHNKEEVIKKSSEREDYTIDQVRVEDHLAGDVITASALSEVLALRWREQGDTEEEIADRRQAVEARLAADGRPHRLQPSPSSASGIRGGPEQVNSCDLCTYQHKSKSLLGSWSRAQEWRAGDWRVCPGGRRTGVKS